MDERIAALLGLEGVAVREAVERDGGWEVEVEPALPKRCANCGGSVHGHGWLPRRRVSHLWIGVRTVHLNWLPQRGLCEQCGKTVTTRPVGLEPWQLQTPQAQEIALVALRRQSFRAVAQDLGASPASLRRLVDRTVPLEDRSWHQIPGDLVLSVDEHSFRGTDLMITIALRSPLKRLLVILPDDRMASLEAWLKELPGEVRDRIRVVSTDLKESYRKVFSRLCPAAVVVPDPFHLVREMTRVLDDVRRLEQAEIRRPIPRWPLVKGAEKLSLPQHGQLAAICRDYPAPGRPLRPERRLPHPAPGARSCPGRPAARPLALKRRQQRPRRGPHAGQSGPQMARWSAPPLAHRPTLDQRLHRRPAHQDQAAQTHQLRLHQSRPLPQEDAARLPPCSASPQFLTQRRRYPSRMLPREVAAAKVVGKL